MRVWAGLVLLAYSATALAAETRTAVPGVPPPPARVADLAWLAGHWEGEGLGGTSYETVSPPLAGQIAAHFQQVSGGKVQFYEFYHFVERDGSILLRIKHFNADMTGWEEKGQTVDFSLVAIEPDTIHFDGLTMKRIGPDGLRSIVRINRGGKVDEVAFTFRRVRP